MCSCFQCCRRTEYADATGTLDDSCRSNLHISLVCKVNTDGKWLQQYRDLRWPIAREKYISGMIQQDIL